MKSKLFLIIKREYLERVRRKSFIITTLLMPIFMVILMVLPGLIMLLSGPEEKTIAVVDASGVIAQSLKGGDEISFKTISPDITVDSIKRLNDYDAVLYIGSNVVENPNSVQFFTHSAPSIATEQFITGQVEDAIRNIRKKNYDIPNLDEILRRIEVDVNMTTYRIDSEDEKETSSIVAYFIALAAAMILYMFILIYGQMVMTSIIEEKNNRVLEVVVSSVNPKSLMLGKVLGIGCVAITQIVIWTALIGCFSRWIMPLFASSSAAAGEPELSAALSTLTDTGYLISLFGYITLFLIAGYMLYSSIFAAIGSSVDNIQDASQLTSIATVPIIIGIMVSMVAMQDPNSSIAFWCSLIPFTSPIVMMGRIPFGIPAWQICLSMAILVASFLAMIWLTAKIYRVGIFMYGKKPTIKDLIRWAKYK